MNVIIPEQYFTKNLPDQLQEIGQIADSDGNGIITDGELDRLILENNNQLNADFQSGYISQRLEVLNQAGQASVDKRQAIQKLEKYLNNAPVPAAVSQLVDTLLSASNKHIEQLNMAEYHPQIAQMFAEDIVQQQNAHKNTRIRRALSRLPQWILQKLVERDVRFAFGRSVTYNKEMNQIALSQITSGEDGHPQCVFHEVGHALDFKPELKVAYASHSVEFLEIYHNNQALARSIIGNYYAGSPEELFAETFAMHCLQDPVLDQLPKLKSFWESQSQQNYSIFDRPLVEGDFQRTVNSFFTIERSHEGDAQTKVHASRLKHTSYPSLG